jgi:hypothetical protein
MDRTAGYRLLTGVLGALFAVGGVTMVALFFGALAPGGEVPGPFVMGPAGVYFMGFAGCALVGWGGGLLGAMRRPDAGRTVGTASAVALVLAAVTRMMAWLMGDYAFLGDLLRGEAAVFLLLALALLWLRPPPAAKGA